ncbi:hypothetical protein [Porphyromonas endodontalis]|nr:hypothetical protein [Porphyromonas endodontalis]
MRRSMRSSPGVKRGNGKASHSYDEQSLRAILGLLPALFLATA